MSSPIRASSPRDQPAKRQRTTSPDGTGNTSGSLTGTGETSQQSLQTGDTSSGRLSSGLGSSFDTTESGNVPEDNTELFLNSWTNTFYGFSQQSHPTTGETFGSPSSSGGSDPSDGSKAYLSSGSEYSDYEEEGPFRFDQMPNELQNHYRSNWVHFESVNLDFVDFVNIFAKTGWQNSYSFRAEAVLGSLIRGIAEGVNHLSTLGIAHGDLNISNVVLFWTDGQSHAGPDRLSFVTPKLIDFSNSQMRQTGTNDPIMANTTLCSIQTAAPETWYHNQPYDVIKGDMFSLGTILLSLLIGCHPFEPSPEFFNPSMPRPQVLSGNNSRDMEKDEISIIIRKDVSFVNRLVQPFNATLKQLLLSSLQPDPQQRVTIDRFLADQWFTVQIEPPS